MKTRYFNFHILLFAVFLVAFSVLPSEAIPVRLEAVGPIIQNTPFNIDVYVDNVPSGEEVYAFGFNLASPGSWTYLGNTVGPSFVSKLGPSDADVSGELDFGAMGPTDDNILLARLGFLASNSGAFTFGITSDISNPLGNQGLWTLGSNDGRYDLTVSKDFSVAPIPEPCTLLIVMTSGLLGIAIKPKKS